MPSSSRILAFLGKGGPVDDIAFTFWVDPRLGQLSGPLGGTPLISTGVASMSAEGIRHHCRTSETLVACKAQLIMYCPQVVDDGSLVLSVFTAPWAVSITSEMPESIGIMNPFQAHDFGGFLGRHHPQEF